MSHLTVALSLIYILSVLPGLGAAPVPPEQVALSNPDPLPRIEFISVPPVGSFEPLRGQVFNVPAASYRIAVFIYVFGWWTKPSWTTPLTEIERDGSWTCDITTGGTDECATTIAAYLVPENYLPPLLGGHSQLPAELDQNSVHKRIQVRAPLARTLTFSGYDWAVKSTGQCQWGPGPNFYSDSTNNVWLDTRGRLHLRLTHRNNRWQCAEVALARPLGYGTYRLVLDSAADAFDRNVVLGFFTWSDDPAFHHREIDIEFSKWSDSFNPNNSQFVVQPFDRAQHLLAFRQPAGVLASTHSFTWEPHQVAFQSLRGSDPVNADRARLIREWTFTRTSEIPPPGDETARINLWLFNGVPPADGQEVEMVVSKFDFIPAAPVLSIRNSAGAAVIRWPSTYPGFIPETAPSAAGPWTSLTTTPSLKDGSLELKLPATQGTMLLRLKK